MKTGKFNLIIKLILVREWSVIHHIISSTIVSSNNHFTLAMTILQDVLFFCASSAIKNTRRTWKHSNEYCLIKQLQIYIVYEFCHFIVYENFSRLVLESFFVSDLVRKHFSIDSYACCSYPRIAMPTTFWSAFNLSVASFATRFQLNIPNCSFYQHYSYILALIDTLAQLPTQYVPNIDSCLSWLRLKCFRINYQSFY